MDKFLELPFSHHAFLFVGDRNTLLEEAKSVLSKHENDFNIEENNFEMLTIDEARGLRAGLSLKPVDDKQRLVFVSLGGANHEAIQTLLKAVEEPGENTRFMFFVGPYISFPETFLSRFIVYRDIGESDIFRNEAEVFLKSSIESRIKIVEKMDADGKKNKEENQFKKEAILLIDAIEPIMYERLKTGEVDTKTMHRILEAKDFLRDRGSMTKMILESLALVIPQSK